MGDCLDVGRAISGALAGAPPLLNGRLDGTGFGVMVGKDLRRGTSNLWCGLLQSDRDALVQLLASALEE